ncbi:hypothetical protein [Cloacibacillus sp. An23]|uniref:hypothetical protein n=1 Tax=Cloacibacillus sp. An23 TaxID=1965591 RepID=UPI00117791A0|nr:hypothetical protein [Cloacibacillus sp. An23]
MDNILSSRQAGPFLSRLEEYEDNELRIVIMGAKTVEHADSDASSDEGEKGILARILSQCRQIAPDCSLSFEIVFEDYIIYQVRRESFCSYDPEEIRSGKFLIVFEKSKLLDYLTVSTDACRLDDGSFYPAEWKHYGIYTQNHVIDVVSQCEPKVLRLTQD